MSDRLRIFTRASAGMQTARRLGRSNRGRRTLRARAAVRAAPEGTAARADHGGLEVGIQLPRGTVLRGGDRLRAADGTVLEIVAAREPVSTVWSRDLRRLALVAYHLGNRHVALEIGTGWVRYLADHVLDEMVAQLGLAVIHHDEPFEPESRRLRQPRARAWRAVAPRPYARPRTRHEHAVPHEHRVIFGGVHRHSHDHER